MLGDKTMKPKIKHTPGPWKYRGWPAKRVDANTDNPAMVGQIAEVDTYGTVNYGIDSKAAGLEAAANAQLISAAPELLAACRAVLRAPSVNSDGPGSSTIVLQDYRRSEIIKAVEKAEGYNE